LFEIRFSQDGFAFLRRMACNLRKMSVPNSEEWKEKQNNIRGKIGLFGK